MIIFNFKTKNYYKISPLVIIGDIHDVSTQIKNFGFFDNSIFIYNKGNIKSNKPFIVSATIPLGWNGEVIAAKDFVKTINARKIITPYNNTTTQNAMNDYYNHIQDVQFNKGCSGCGAEHRVKY